MTAKTMTMMMATTMTATNHDDQLCEIYHRMLNELNCTFGVSFFTFLLLWPSWSQFVAVVVCGRHGIGPQLTPQNNFTLLITTVLTTVEGASQQYLLLLLSFIIIIISLITNMTVFLAHHDNVLIMQK